MGETYEVRLSATPIPSSGVSKHEWVVGTDVLQIALVGQGLISFLSTQKQFLQRQISVPPTVAPHSVDTSLLFSAPPHDHHNEPVRCVYCHFHTRIYL